ncbi:MAG: N-acetyl sugar amidotransferase [Candidatus Thorarchaeota archaeon]
MYQRCNRCVMDTTDPNIVFDDAGICNHCTNWFELWETKIDRRPIEEVLLEIKSRKTGKYDAIVGISGGVDSSMVAYLAKKHGLNVLLLHVYDGWNTEAADKNVQIIQDQTGFDFEQVNLDGTEFTDIIHAYFKAGVQGLEAPTDHFIVAALHEVMDKHGIKTILSGGNWVTEGILPSAWVYTQHDDTNIKSIHKKYGTIPLKNSKFMGILTKTWRLTRGGIKSYRLLNHVDYNRDQAVKTLSEEWRIVDYGGKHQENVFTRFVEAYIFPIRFGFDIRLAYLSPIICSGQKTRDEVLKILDSPPFSPEEAAKEKDIFLKGLGLTEQQFEDFMNSPIRNHDEFSTHKRSLQLLGVARKVLGRDQSR